MGAPLGLRGRPFYLGPGLLMEDLLPQCGVGVAIFRPLLTICGERVDSACKAYARRRYEPVDVGVCGEEIHRDRGP